MLVSKPDLGPTFFNAMQEISVKKGDCQVDLRDTGLGEVACQAIIISGCFARKKKHFNTGRKYGNMKEIDYQVYGYWQRSGLGHIGR